MDGVCQLDFTLDRLVKLFLEDQPRAISSGLFSWADQILRETASHLLSGEEIPIWQHSGNFVMKKVEILPLNV